MIRLDDLRNSFEGVIPAIIGTLDGDGMPNISYLSHVYYVDDSHVALSNQFFSKTADNVKQTGVATVMVVDPTSGGQHVLDLQFERSCDDGDIFEQVSTHLDVMSMLHGVADVMKLRSADIYRVSAVRQVLGAAPLAPEPEPLPRCNRLARSARIITAIAAEDDADTILDAALDGLRDEMQFDHVMVLLPDDDGETLSTVASRGYDRFGAGAEIGMGVGVIGMAAKARRAVRIADLSRVHRYARAISEGGLIPLPGLDRPQCQMAVPMLVKGQLRGIVFVESEQSFAYTHEDEEALILIANQLGSALLLAELQAQSAPARQPAAVTPVIGGGGFRFKYYAHDDSVFIDDDYLIKGVPGRLLYHFVRSYVENGRSDFSNREIRRETALKLPDIKDNLETRLILLRKRLEDKSGPLRLTRPERGQVRLEVDGLPRIEIVVG